MTKVKMQASAEDVAQAQEDQGEFVVPPAGYYYLRLVEATPGFSKTDGEEDKKKPRLELVYEIVGVGKEHAEPTMNFGRLWDYVSFSKESGWKRAETVRAFYPDRVQVGEALNTEIDTEEIVEREVFARLKHEKDKLKSEEEGRTVTRARIARILPVNGDEFASAEAADVEYDGTEASNGDDANPFAEGGEGLLTGEELQAMDLKELGAVAKEFDLDPMTLVVKNRAKKVDADKTKAAVIEAILTAQGAEDEDTPSEEGGDEDPF